MTDRDEQLEARLRARRLRHLSDEASHRLLVDLESVAADDAQPRQREVAPAPKVPAGRAYRLAAVVAIAATLLVALGIWYSRQDGPARPPQQPLVTLAANWRLTPTGKADYQVVEPMLVRLHRGELLVESTENKSLGTRRDGEASLRIETPAGEAVAKGTRFFIGAHQPTVKGDSVMSKSLTRVLVLSGVVALANASGSVEGTRGALLAAEPNKAPTKLVVRANSDFAMDLYQQLAQENEGQNLFFSPYSISGALAMTAEGARGETVEQMGRVLRFPEAARRVGDDAQLIPWETSLIHTGMASLNDRITGEKDEAVSNKIRAQIVELRKQYSAAKQQVAQLRQQRKWKALPAAQKKEKELAQKLYTLSSQVDQYEIRIANAMWGEKTYPFRQEFIDTVNKHYDTGGIFPVDFRTNHEAVRQRINGWVEGQTNDRIQDLVPQGAVDDLTRLVLTNAIYFKGDWAEPFKEHQTKDQDFTTTGGKKVKTPLMAAHSHQAARYAAFNADGSFFKSPQMISRGQQKRLYPGKRGFAMVELPYKGGELSMVVIAPNDPQGLPGLEAKLTSEHLSTWVGQLKQRKTHVYLPKFKLETEYTLGDSEQPRTLQQMGMVRAFADPRDPKQGAQFDGMCASADPSYRLYISKVLHKAFVEVNEKGTEAAAATAVVMSAVRSAPRTTPFIPTFKADRPFIYLIRDKVTGSILFLGRMMEPNI